MSINRIPISIVNKSNNTLPEYATAFTSGMDVCAFTDEPIIIPPGNRKLIKTGLFISVPNGYEIQLRQHTNIVSRWVSIMNTPYGVMDASCQCELEIILINLGSTHIIIENGSWISQLVLYQVPKIKWEVVNEL